MKRSVTVIKTGQDGIRASSRGGGGGTISRMEVPVSGSLTVSLERVAVNPGGKEKKGLLIRRD